MSEKRIPLPKTQKEILLDQQEMYLGDGNPNFINPNRSNELSFKGDNTKPTYIGLENIDESIIYYFNNVIKPRVIQNNKMVSVPVIYGSPEKWKSYQKDGYYRDKQGSILYPLIMFKRNNISKDRSISNKINANNPHNYYITKKRYSKTNYYDKFSLLTNKTPVNTFYASVIPDYLILNYTCVIFTYYNSQINKLIEAIEYNSDSYWGDKEKYQFQARIDTFDDVKDLSNDKDRFVSCTFNIKINGYIVPELQQKDVSSVMKFNSKPKSIFFYEHEDYQIYNQDIIVISENNWDLINTNWEHLYNLWESYL